MINIIFWKVSQETKISRQLITKRTRKREIVQARQLVQYFLERYTKLSLPEIGKLTGGFDHSTILASKKNIKNLMDTDKHFREWVKEMDKYFQKKFKKKTKKRKEETTQDLINEVKQGLDINRKILLNEALQNMQVVC